MNAPLPYFTSSTRPSMPSAIFFLMMRRRDKRDALHRRRHVAQGVELAVGRRDLGRLSDRARADCARSRAASPRARDRTGNRGCLQLVEGAAGVAEPAPVHHRDPIPQAAASGARMSETLSPTPPVECLSISGLGAEKSSGSPTCSIPSRTARSPRREPAKEDRHQQRRHLVVRHLTRGVPVHQLAELAARQDAAVALALDQTGDEHYATFTPAEPHPCAR